MIYLKNEFICFVYSFLTGGSGQLTWYDILANAYEGQQHAQNHAFQSSQAVLFK